MGAIATGAADKVEAAGSLELYYLQLFFHFL
jgi:hypothetical protein